MLFSTRINRAGRIDSDKYTSTFREFFKENSIFNILVLDKNAFEEILIFNQLKVNIYVDFDNKYIQGLFKKEFKNIKPTAQLLDKADLILLPSDSSLAQVDIDEERKKLRKKGFVIYKTYNCPKKHAAPVVFQQIIQGIGFVTMLSYKQIVKSLITKQDTGYFAFEKDEFMSASEVKAAIRYSGFKKVYAFDESGLPFDEQASKLAYRVYRKAKSVPMPEEDEEEENLPLMTSGEISSKFNEIMSDNQLKREDFNL